MNTCNKCGQIIKWEKNDNDKWIPKNENGSDHFDTCQPDPKVVEFYKNNPELLKKIPI